MFRDQILTTADLREFKVELIGEFQRINTCTSAITPETAVLFERVLKIPARFWLQREYHYQEYLAKLEALKEMKE